MWTKNTWHQIPTLGRMSCPTATGHPGFALSVINLFIAIPNHPNQSGLKVMSAVDGFCVRDVKLLHEDDLVVRTFCPASTA